MTWKEEFKKKFSLEYDITTSMLRWIESNAGRIMRAKQLSKQTKAQRTEVVKNLNIARANKRKKLQDLQAK